MLSAILYVAIASADSINHDRKAQVLASKTWLRYDHTVSVPVTNDIFNQVREIATTWQPQ
jgi:hypothetical protein